MNTPASDALLGLVVGERYEVTAALGVGGAGHVYKAIQRPLGRDVAIKVLRDDLTPEARKTFEDRFLREAALAGRLQHANLVTVHDYGTDRGLSYVVMELLDGRTLHRRLKTEGAMDPLEAARIAAAVARGLRHAHHHGLVHRDVKPNNIMLVPDEDGTEHPKLVDFGLVKSTGAVDMQVTDAHRFMGTPAFMAPEQAERPDIDGRADQYALGCVLYLMLTGQIPFDADTAIGMALQHKSNPIPRMAERSGVAVPPALEAIVRQAMAKRPEDRFDDCGQLADALDDWLHTAHPPPPAPRSLTPWILAGVGLGAVALGVAAMVVVAGGAGLVVGWWMEPREAPELVAVPAQVETVPVAATPTPEPAPAPEPEPEPATAPAPAPVPRPAAAPEPEPAPEPAPAPVPIQVPRSAPVPVPAPAAPAPAPAPAPAAPAPAAPAPAPAPWSKPEPEPAPPGFVRVDDVLLSDGTAARTVQFVNTASYEDLAKAGVYRQGITVILDQRPFADIQAFAATRGIGTKTVEAVSKGR